VDNGFESFGNLACENLSAILRAEHHMMLTRVGRIMV
jgi:hypothetical protein